MVPPLDSSPRRLVLLVEDEPSIADTLIYALRTEGFTTHHCLTGEEALAFVAEREPALVVLDVGLPDMSGFDWCRDVRRRSTVPILFLTARAEEIDRVVGLEIGGDDYVTKPFSPREVTARVKAILRRPAPPPAAGPDRSDEAGGELDIDADACAVWWHGVRLELTRYEFRLLRHLARHPGRVFSREALMSAVWEDPGASLDRTVDAHIKTIRGKLRDVMPNAEPIQTHRGMGYSWKCGQ